jgi:hypothetical protein
MNYKTAHTKEHWVFILEDSSTHNFGNENLSESDAEMMLKARETNEIQTAQTDDGIVIYAPNEEPKRAEPTATIDEIYDIITDYK